MVFAPEIDPNLDPYYVILKSIHNTIIEGFWRWLREKLGLNLREIIWQGKTEHIFNPMVPFHAYVELPFLDRKSALDTDFQFSLFKAIFSIGYLFLSFRKHLTNSASGGINIVFDLNQTRTCLQDMFQYMHYVILRCTQALIV